jgi:hypothetical protein
MSGSGIARRLGQVYTPMTRTTVAMGASVSRLRPVLVVRVDGSVGLRMGMPSSTPGLIVVPECPRCIDVDTSARHHHRSWRIQTSFGYLVGDLSSRPRTEALAAAAALGQLDVRWDDPRVLMAPLRTRAVVNEVLACWRICRAA